MDKYIKILKYRRMKWLFGRQNGNYPNNHQKYNGQDKNNIKKCLGMKKLKNSYTNFFLTNIFLFYILLIYAFPMKIIERNRFLALSNAGIITIKIEGREYQSIIGKNYLNSLFPDSVFIGENRIGFENDDDKYGKIYIDPSSNEINSIKLVWDNNDITSFQGIFADLLNLKEVDLSQFDSSSIVDLDDMFFGCESLTSIIFGNFNTESIVSMVSMFSGCSSLLELNLSSFDTSKVTNMSFVFYGCQSIKKLYISNFKTSEVIDMSAMFYNLSSVEDLDLNSFDTSKVLDMSYMFYGCLDLISLDLSQFNTSSVRDMSAMFYNNINLTYLNLTSFDTSNVENMKYMFNGCISIPYLNLANFKTHNVSNMEYMFCECNSLNSLEISNFDTSNVNTMGFMFCECNSLKSINLSNFNTINVEFMDYMFYDCESLSSLDLSSFDTRNVQYIDYMFSYCYLLPSLDLSNFNTPELISMERMFHSCISLTSLDISNFNIEKIESLEETFYNCQSLLSLNISNFKTNELNNTRNTFSLCSNLTYLDLSNLDTSKVVDMDSMFSSCENLKYLNINFETSSVTNMRYMFYNCSSLTSLNVSSFDTSRVEQMDFMFSGCKNLVELDLSNFGTNSVVTMEEMFSNCTNLEYINFIKYNEPDDLNINKILEEVPENIAICINKEDSAINLELLQIIINLKQCPTISCDTDWRSKQKKRIAENNTCIENCNNFKYEYDNKCYSICPEFADFCQSETSTMHTTENLDTTNDNFNERSIISTEVNPYFTNSYSNIVNDTFSLPNNYNETYYMESTNSDTIINETNKLIIPSSIIINNPNISTEKTYNNTDKSNQEIYKEVIKDKMKDYDVSEGEEIIIKGENNFFYQITTSENDKNFLDEINNKTNQFSKIDLGECENYLKDHYHINRNISLIIVKFEKMTNNSLERSLQYEVYEPFNKTKLNLSICSNTSIDIYVPMILSEELNNLYNELKDLGYDLFDEKSDFYQDICTPFKSPNGTDVLLSDRYNYYFNNHETVCQSNCKFSDYSIESQYLKCECDVSNSKIDTEDVKKFTPKTLYESFYDILKFSNYKVLKCYKLAFSMNSLKINKGSIITIVYFTIYLVFLIIYCIKGINRLKIDLSKKIFNNNSLKLSNDLNGNNNIQIWKNSVENFDFSNANSSNEINSNKNNGRLKSKNVLIKNDLKKKRKTKVKFKYPPKKNSFHTDIIMNQKKSFRKSEINIHKHGKKLSGKNLLTGNKNNSTQQIHHLSKEIQSKENNNQDLNLKSSEVNEEELKEELDNFELNNLDYDLATKLDKREFLEIYWSILKREHLIFFTFFIRNDYNINYVKFSRFIFLVCTDMALNVFFFADETMHKMFLDYGKYNFLQQIPQIIYSTLVSQLIEVFLCFLSLTDKHFYEIKNFDSSSRYKMFPIIKCVKIKIIFFYLFTFIMFAFYWYTITCFCAVYNNTQNAFIKDSFSSFGLGLLYPFVLYLFPSALRIIAIRATKVRLTFLYSLSNIIPFF